MNSRRGFLQLAAMTPFAACLPWVSHAAGAPFPGKFLVTIQARGGWDVSCFCDPKINQIGEREITKWSKSGDIQAVSNIIYAPFAENRRFFEKHGQKMLVINGVDSMTNSHTIGETVNWSGRTAQGYPSLTALYSATNAPLLPMSYVTFGGFSRAENIVRATQLDSSVSEISTLLQPNEIHGAPMINEGLWSLVKSAHKDESKTVLSSAGVVAGNLSSRRAYLSSIINMDPLREFAESLPSDGGWERRSQSGNLRQQAQFTVAAFRAGVSVASDLSQGGFDTHDDNDVDQALALADLVDGIDYLWDTAADAGIADRLVVVVGSDFSRTPYYNEGAGKDHWPIGSYIIMEQGASYTNKVIEGTDELQNAIAIDTETLEPSNFGTKILTSHVHDSLRDYLDLSGSEMARAYPLNNVEKFDFFAE